MTLLSKDDIPGVDLRPTFKRTIDYLADRGDSVAAKELMAKALDKDIILTLDSENARHLLIAAKVEYEQREKERKRESDEWYARLQAENERKQAQAKSHSTEQGKPTYNRPSISDDSDSPRGNKESLVRPSSPQYKEGYANGVSIAEQQMPTWNAKKGTPYGEALRATYLESLEANKKPRDERLEMGMSDEHSQWFYGRYDGMHDVYARNGIE